MATYPVGLPTGSVTVSIYELLADTLSDGDDLPDAADVTLTVEFLPTCKAIRFGGKIYRLRGLTWTGTSVLTAPDGTGGFVLPSTDTPASDGATGWFWQARLSIVAGGAATQLTSEPFRLASGAAIDLATATTGSGTPLLPLEVQSWDVGALVVPGASLPDQSGQGGKVLGTDGATASWQAVGAGAVEDATAAAKGVIQLAGALTGTAAAPALAANSVTAATIADATVTDAEISPSAAIAQGKVANLTTDLASRVTTTTAVNAGTGLTGGGTLSSTRTLSVDFGVGTNQAARGDHAHSDEVAIARLPPGVMVAAYWSAGAAAWQYAGVTLTARPAGLPTDVPLVLIGAPAATADPGWMLTIDLRIDA